eukprot:CAMPEP_0183503056 /NCGR_PEP_ID=MMETSP0371-20130417/4807_1 /TAXON_ID=268820 /ORGANISM="Peridinium aciculiferum, Strain PAER-2" /LENGTH=51 /DNA_ID=CAMNT_0025698023 /DNA_START=51 /DNA_END=203 /DNA_ORIENTATION=+
MRQDKRASEANGIEAARKALDVGLEGEQSARGTFLEDPPEVDQLRAALLLH